LDIRHQTANFVNASWSLVELRDLIFDMLSLLSTELGEHGGMAGDDEAGRAFAAVYKEAVKTLFEQAGFAHRVMAAGAGALLKSAEEFLKAEDRIAAELLTQSPQGPEIGSQPSGPDCSPRASHNAEDLPEVVGETSGVDQYLFNERFLGQPGKLRAVAGSWRSAGKILESAYWDSAAAWKRATLDEVGETADRVEEFFRRFVGKRSPSSSVSEDETLMANLPAACKMIADACDAYADHIETAKQRLPYEETSPTGEILMPWEQPRFGRGRQRRRAARADRLRHADHRARQDSARAGQFQVPGEDAEAGQRKPAARSAPVSGSAHPCPDPGPGGIPTGQRTARAADSAGPTSRPALPAAHARGADELPDLAGFSAPRRRFRR
jgi:hypothetical protein